MQQAAVVRDPHAPPLWSAFAEPIAANGEAIVTVEAAALSPLTRAIASGKHYSSAAMVNFIAGVDGVGQLDDGRRVNFAFPRAPFGAMAERVPIPNEQYCFLPTGVNLVTAAAIANPGMSSWVALAERARFRRKIYCCDRKAERTICTAPRAWSQSGYHALGTAA